jgi:putative endopeptidase
VRRLLHLAMALGVVACRPQIRRAAGDESPLPAIDESSIQRDVAPCQDFYQYACGGFTAGAPIPADRTQWSRAGELEERNARLLRRVLEEAEAGKVDPRERFGRKAGDY